MPANTQEWEALIRETETLCGGSKDQMIGMLAQRLVSLRQAVRPIAYPRRGTGEERMTIQQAAEIIQQTGQIAPYH